MRNPVHRLLCLPLAVLACTAAYAGHQTIETTTTEMLGDDGADNYSDAIDPGERISWHVYVPDGHDASVAAGVIVYISPSDSGRIPPRWTDAFDERNLIWIAGNQSGNERQVARRMALALLAVGVVSENWQIDRERIYLSGFSGGARVAGLITPRFAHLFKGAIFIGGAESWRGDDLPERIESMRGNRYVFIAGSHDFNRSMVLSVRDAYADAGITNIDTILMPRVGHDLPSPATFEDALDFLEPGERPAE